MDIGIESFVTLRLAQEMQYLARPGVDWLWFSAVGRNMQFQYCGNRVTPTKLHTGTSCVLPWVGTAKNKDCSCLRILQ